MDIQALLERMTIRQKLAQLTQLDNSFFAAREAGSVTGPMESLKLTAADVAACGSALNSFGAAQTREIQRQHLEKDPNHIPLLFMLDVIHGYRTIYPVPLALGCAFDPELMTRLCAMAATEAAASGIHVTFSPMADLVRDARWGRVMESTGEDPYLNALYAAAAVKGYQKDDLKDPQALAACVKHFAAYGAPEAGREYAPVELGGYTLHEYYLPAYRAAVEAGVEMLMTSFNTVNGVPSTGNRALVRDLLRGDWGFDGVTISDYASVHELCNHGVAENGGDAARLALAAGVDIEMMSVDYLHNAAQEAVSPLTQIDEAVARVLRLKDKLGLFEDPYHGASPEAEAECHLCAAHRALAREAAARSMVLLKNEGETLPLVADKTVALIGPFARSRELIGNWPGVGRHEDVVTLEEGLHETLPADRLLVCEATGFHWRKDAAFVDPDDTLDLEGALQAARAAEVVVLAIGEHEQMSGEGLSRACLDLPGRQQELVDAVCALGKPVVAVVFGGRPLTLRPLSERVDALLFAWFPGVEGGHAVADLLFGDRLPEGRLSMAFPYTTGQCPVYYNHLNTGRPIDRENSPNRYLARYQDIPNAPLYPFGYGLGYSTAAYRGLTLSADRLTDSLDASVEVVNTGRRPLTETVQLYVQDVVGSVARPVRELKGFQKVTLAPGESRTVTFRITPEMLAFAHANDARYAAWYAEPGRFRLWLAPDSASGEAAEFTY